MMAGYVGARYEDGLQKVAGDIQRVSSLQVARELTFRFDCVAKFANGKFIENLTGVLGQPTVEIHDSALVDERGGTACANCGGGRKRKAYDLVGISRKRRKLYEDASGSEASSSDDDSSASDKPDDNDDGNLSEAEDESLFNGVLSRNRHMGPEGDAEARNQYYRSVKIMKKAFVRMGSEEKYSFFRSVLTWDDVLNAAQCKAAVSMRKGKVEYAAKVAAIVAWPNIADFKNVDALKDMTNSNQEQIFNQVTTLPAVIKFHETVTVLISISGRNSYAKNKNNKNALMGVFRPVPSVWFVTLLRFYEVSTEGGPATVVPVNMEGRAWRTVAGRWLRAKGAPTVARDAIRGDGKTDLKYYALDLQCQFASVCNLYGTVPYNYVKPENKYTIRGGKKGRQLRGFTNTALLVHFALAMCEEEHYHELLNNDGEFRWIKSNMPRLISYVNRAVNALRSSFTDNHYFDATKRGPKLKYSMLTRGAAGDRKAMSVTHNVTAVPSTIVSVLRLFVIRNLESYEHDRNMRGTYSGVEMSPNEVRATNSCIGLLLNFDKMAKSVKNLRSSQVQDVTMLDDWAKHESVVNVYLHLMAAALTAVKVYDRPASQIDGGIINTAGFLSRTLRENADSYTYVSTTYAFPGIMLNNVCFRKPNHLMTAKGNQFFANGRQDRVNFVRVMGQYFTRLPKMAVKQYHEEIPVNYHPTPRHLPSDKYFDLLNLQYPAITVVTASFVNILATGNEPNTLRENATKMFPVDPTLNEQQVYDPLQESSGTAVAGAVDDMILYTLPLSYSVFYNLSNEIPPKKSDDGSRLGDFSSILEFVNVLGAQPSIISGGEGGGANYGDSNLYSTYNPSARLGTYVPGELLRV